MRILFFIASFLFCNVTFSQDNEDGNYTVGILPVTSVGNDAREYSSMVQAALSKVFSEKKRFTVVDRSKFDQLIKERNLQKQEDFLNGEVVEQGKSLGAEYLISGNINQVSKRAGNKEKSKMVYDEVTKKIVTQKYYVYVTQIDITVNVQVIDVATGVVKSNKSYSTSRETETSSEATAVNNAVRNLEVYFRAWVNNTFPVYMRVIKVETINKKGLPEKILIKGGDDVDLSYNKTWLSNNSSELEVFENEILTVDGKEYKRQVVIGKIRIDEVQGEFSICKVRSGAEEIQKKLNEGKTLFLKISRY